MKPTTSPTARPPMSGPARTPCSGCWYGQGWSAGGPDCCGYAGTCCGSGGGRSPSGGSSGPLMSPPPRTHVEHQGSRTGEHQGAQPHQDETGVAQLAARPKQARATSLGVADEAEPREEHQRERTEQPAQQGDRGEHAEPKRVERRVGVRRVLTDHLPRVAAHRGAPVAVEMRERLSGSQAWTAQNGAHWWLSSALTVATCTQHWVSRSSIIVFMSMKGFTVTRRTRSPSIL